MPTTIQSLHAQEILDSRGNPTVEATLTLKNSLKAKAAVPSGASTGKYEALELRDEDESRYNGKGVLQACENINTIISQALKGQDALKQSQIDHIMIELDGTPNKSKLGANAILGVSLACARAAARSQSKELYEYIRSISQFPISQFPTPMMNILNGGRHAKNNLPIQEFMIVPIGIKDIKEQMQAGSEIFNQLKEILKSQNLSTAMGDEGGFAPQLKNNEQALDLLLQAIEQTNYTTDQIKIALDAAASEFYQNDKYKLGDKTLSSQELIVVYETWSRKYPIISIEDGLSEDDWQNWSILRQRLESLDKNFLIVGDDLTVTNIARLQKALEKEAINAILIKLNQIGTLSETLECIKLSQENNLKIIISHRSGETLDTFIADLAVGVGAEFLKAGAPSLKERMCKYERLIEMSNYKIQIPNKIQMTNNKII